MAGSAPAICTEMGSTSPSWLARLRVFSLPQRSEFDATISDTARPAPNCLHNCLKGRSVTPAIGATNRLFRNVREPIRIDDHGVFLRERNSIPKRERKGKRLTRVAREKIFKTDSAARNGGRAGLKAERALRKSCVGRENAVRAAAHRARPGPRRAPARAVRPNSK